MFTMIEDYILMPDGTEGIYTIIDFPDFACVLPVFGDKFVLIRNYRYPIDEFVLEVPAGLIDEGEPPEETVRRELEEETGYRLKNIRKLCTYQPIASLNTQTAHIFMGDAEEGGAKKRDPLEDMETVLLPIDEVYRMLDKGELTHPHTMLALFYARELVD